MSLEIAVPIFIIAGFIGVRLITGIIEDHLRMSLKIRQAENRILLKKQAIRRHSRRVAQVEARLEEKPGPG